MKKKRKRSAVDLSILGVIISVAFYAGLVIFSDIREIADGFERVRPDNYPLVVLLSFAAYSILAIRYRYLLGAVGVSLPLRDSFLVSFSSQSMFSTFGRAGTIIKSYLVKKRYGHPVSRTGPVILFEQFLDLKSAVLVLLVGMAWFQIFEVQLLLVAGAALTVALYLMMRYDWAFDMAKAVLSKIRFLKRFAGSIDESRESARDLLSARRLAVSTGLSFAVKMLQVAVVFLVFDSLGLDLEFLKSGMIYFASVLAGVLVLLPGGIVVTDSAMLGLLVGEGIDLPTGSVAVIITRFVTLWFTVIVGMVALKITLVAFRARFAE